MCAYQTGGVQENIHASRKRHDFIEMNTQVHTEMLHDQIINESAE